MRIALLTAGGYPYRRDPLGALCRYLVGGLDRHTFHLLTVTDQPRRDPPAYPLPRHVATARAVCVAEGDRRPAPAGRDDDATTAAVLLCRGVLDEGAHGGEMFTAGLRRLATVAARTPEPLRAVPLAEVLVDAWRISRTDGRGRSGLPRLSLRDARHAAALLQRASRALAVRVPAADVVHCVGGTTAVLAALANGWRQATPVLLTEARTPAQTRPGEDRLPPAVRLVLRRFRRAVARAGYAHARLVAAVSDHHRELAVHSGADPARLVTVPAVADPERFTAAPETSSRPSLVATGIDTGARLDLLLEAFGQVLAGSPGVLLHLIGTDGRAGQLHAHQERVHQAGLGAAVRISAPPVDRRPSYADAQVVVHLPGPADPPHRLAEAMLSGRPVVGVDVGPVAETLGDAGVVVPADDPAALAAACVGLLRSHPRRTALGDAARRRALALFTPDRLARAYDALYEDVAAPPTTQLPRHEFDLAIPAPRQPVPATIAWLALEER